MEQRLHAKEDELEEMKQRLHAKEAECTSLRERLTTDDSVKLERSEHELSMGQHDDEAYPALKETLEPAIAAVESD